VPWHTPCPSPMQPSPQSAFGGKPCGRGEKITSGKWPVNCADLPSGLSGRIWSVKERQRIALDFQRNSLPDQLYVQAYKGMALDRRYDPFDALERTGSHLDAASGLNGFACAEGWINQQRLADLRKLVEEFPLARRLDYPDDRVAFQERDALFRGETREHVAWKQRFCYRYTAPLVDLRFGSQREIVGDAFVGAESGHLLLAACPEM